MQPLDVFPSAQTSRSGSLIGGRYRIHGFVGKGATARVYLAEDLAEGRPVVVKILTAGALGAGQTTKRRFLREAKAAMRVSHPNVVRLLDVAELRSGTPYLVVEPLRGETLGDLLRREGAVAPDLALILAHQAAAGLAAAHRAGVVHRDVKPDNLFLVGEIGAPYGLKVIDFGLAKLELRSGASSMGLILGTLEYMAPEQVVAEQNDARTDVYGLGAVLFRMLTGHLPFAGADHVALLAHHLCSRPPPPSWLNAALDPRIDQVVLTALRKDPARRYPSMDAMLGDLDRLLGLRDEEIEGAPPGAGADVYVPQTELGKRAHAMLGERLAPW